LRAVLVDDDTCPTSIHVICFPSFRELERAESTASSPHRGCFKDTFVLPNAAGPDVYLAAGGLVSCPRVKRPLPSIPRFLSSTPVAPNEVRSLSCFFGRNEYPDLLFISTLCLPSRYRVCEARTDRSCHDPPVTVSRSVSCAKRAGTVACAGPPARWCRYPTASRANASAGVLRRLVHSRRKTARRGGHPSSGTGRRIHSKRSRFFVML